MGASAEVLLNASIHTILLDSSICVIGVVRSEHFGIIFLPVHKLLPLI